ncbi:Vacuolar H+-transporting two-sector ATPase, F subunit [Pyrobaculum islandicum DSM 4184]|uniref:Vacuolar H+-transporting two-sector ATPase, F subunit n=1 Tax=Pyrobaculum islandicum (strain DSM 4184 / JCM 9189 / GEO3) TaxID=384616 RepID=A1RSF3_PYRIL|nr:V-type ATP synthase subunit F [Pyrobaculum islandicum]ABL87885.1 Vacuolar H+-transporting two-sector ATPase, F subunit [Pyrobaculum islandicum DSM 4184]
MHIVIGDRTTVALFKLMGFEGKTIESPEEALKFIKERLDTYDVIFITSKIAKAIRKELDEIRMRNPRKLLVEVPSVEEGMEREVNYLQIVRQVLGG